jgi:hypothetical protein
MAAEGVAAFTAAGVGGAFTEAPSMGEAAEASAEAAVSTPVAALEAPAVGQVLAAPAVAFVVDRRWVIMEWAVGPTAGSVGRAA